MWIRRRRRLAIPDASNATITHRLRRRTSRASSRRLEELWASQLNATVLGVGIGIGIAIDHFRVMLPMSRADPDTDSDSDPDPDQAESYRCKAFSELAGVEHQHLLGR